MIRQSTIATALVAAASIVPAVVAGVITPTSQERWVSSTVGDLHQQIDSPDFSPFHETVTVSSGALTAECSQDTTIGNSSIFGTMGGHVTPGAASTFTWCEVAFAMTVDGTYTIEASTPYLGGFVLYVWDAEGVSIFDRPFSSADGNYFFEDVIPAGDYTLLVAVFSNGDGTGYLDVGGSFEVAFVPSPGTSAVLATTLIGVFRRRRSRSTRFRDNNRP